MNGSITGTHTIGILSYSGDFQVRPTKVKFYYRYIPEGDDVGVIHSSLSLFVINKGNIINIKLATIMFISSIPPNFSFYCFYSGSSE